MPVPFHLPPFNAPSPSFSALLNIVPSNEIEERLLATIEELFHREALQYGALQNVHYEQIHSQLHV